MPHQRLTRTDECLILAVGQLLRSLRCRLTATINCNHGSVACAIDRVNDRLRLAYKLANGQHNNCEIDLVTDQPHFGGTRWWFSCPFCERRCRKLYVVPGRYLPGCRGCHGVAYRSQLQRPLQRTRQRAVSLRVQLGGAADLDQPFPSRPRRMWRRTYWTRLDKLAKAEARFYKLVVKRLEGLIA